MDWQDCGEIEIVPSKVGGSPVIKGTRVPDVILADDSPRCRFDTILKIRAFADNHQLQP